MEIKTRTILQQALDDLKELASNKDEEIYIEQMNAKAEELLDYITTLQRKEYNTESNEKQIKEKSEKLLEIKQYCINLKNIYTDKHVIRILEYILKIIDK